MRRGSIRAIGVNSPVALFYLKTIESSLTTRINHLNPLTMITLSLVGVFIVGGIIGLIVGAMLNAPDEDHHDFHI